MARIVQTQLTFSTYSKTKYNFPLLLKASFSSTMFSCFKVRSILSSRKVVSLTSSFSGVQSKSDRVKLTKKTKQNPQVTRVTHLYFEPLIKFSVSRYYSEKGLIFQCRLSLLPVCFCTGREVTGNCAIFMQLSQTFHHYHLGFQWQKKF